MPVDAVVRGTSMFRGIVERMTKELTALVPSTMRIKRVHRFGVDWMSPPFDLRSAIPGQVGERVDGYVAPSMSVFSWTARNQVIHFQKGLQRGVR